jgi:hypothetical protein
MARIAVEGDRVVVRLSGLERLGAFIGGDVSVPLSSVRAASVAPDPWTALRGIRAPGTGWPGVIALGHRRGSGIHDFAAVYGHRPAVVVDLAGDRFDRLVVSTDDAQSVAAEIDRTAG